MKRLSKIISLVWLLWPIIGIAQMKGPDERIWKLTSLGGELRLNGFYRNQIRSGLNFNEKQESKQLFGGILLKTKSYIWHPRFLNIEVDGQYEPRKNIDKYLVIPELSENINLQKFDTRLSFFPQSKVSLSTFYNYFHVYNSRENLSTLESFGKNYGSILYFKSRYLPMSIGYIKSDNDQAELQTQRHFIDRQEHLELRMNTNSKSSDHHEWNLSHNQYYRRDFSMGEIQNQINNLNYLGNIFLGKGKEKRNNIISSLRCVWQKGFETYTNYQLQSSFNHQWSKNLRGTLRYAYNNDQRKFQSSSQHNTGFSLSHQLFQSLATQLDGGLISTYNSNFKQTLIQGSINANYQKRIAKYHRLDLNIRYNLQSQQWNANDHLLAIVQEPIKLSDGSINLLSKSNVNLATVIVTDGTGTIIYQKNVDYILTVQNNFVQILRVSGGLIPNNTTVYVDYSAMQPGNYEYLTSNQFIGGGISLFNQLIYVYAHQTLQRYLRADQTENFTQNTFTQKVIGIRTDYHGTAFGVEWEDMKSTVLPYRLIRAYGNAQKYVLRKLMISIHGNLYNYAQLGEMTNLIYADASGGFTYPISNQFSFGITGSYNKQKGQSIDLDLINVRTEFTASIEKLRMSLNYTYYDRRISEELIRFNSFNVLIARRF